MTTTEHTAIIPTIDGQGQLHVSTRVSTGAGMLGFALSFGDDAPTPVAWVYVVDLCAALAGGFDLSLIGQGGASLGDPFSWIRRRNITMDPSNGEFLVKTQDGAKLFAVHALIDPPDVEFSPRGNPTIHPVNTQVTLELTVGEQRTVIDPRRLIETLIENQTLIRWTDTQRVLTRHLEPVRVPFETWPTGWMVPVSLNTRVE